MTNLRSRRECAKLYAENGLPVFRVIPGEKTPVGGRGHLDATTDLATAENWWGENPEYNIGCAVPTGLVVVDIDCKGEYHDSDGIAEFQKLVEKHGKLPETWVAQTPTGGFHYWFRTTVTEFNKGICPGVDLKAGGKGYVLLPPSIHPNGKPYQWSRSPRWFK